MKESGAAPTYVSPRQLSRSSPIYSPSALKAAEATQEDIDSMRISAMKQELESYGISTKAFLEKKELVEALKKARADGLKPKENSKSSSSGGGPSSSSTTASSASASASETKKTEDSRPRVDRLNEEIARCEKMKNSELKQELKERGISTAAFFEKSEFVEALAAARVDGVNKKGGSSSSNEEGYAEYADVEVVTDGSAGPRPKGETKQGSPSPFGDGSSPFGGGNPFDGAAGGSPFGGAAGMGGFADILKNMQGMGGGGGAGTNPFAGAGANPFGGMGGMGDAMGKAQELMKNPKVMELMMKAQKNPKVMKAMQECMSNPAAISKYQNDPEIAELVNELQKYM